MQNIILTVTEKLALCSFLRAKNTYTDLIIENPEA